MQTKRYRTNKRKNRKNRKSRKNQKMKGGNPKFEITIYLTPNQLLQIVQSMDKQNPSYSELNDSDIQSLITKILDSQTNNHKTNPRYYTYVIETVKAYVKYKREGLEKNDVNKILKYLSENSLPLFIPFTLDHESFISHKDDIYKNIDIAIKQNVLVMDPLYIDLLKENIYGSIMYIRFEAAKYHNLGEQQDYVRKRLKTEE